MVLTRRELLSTGMKLTAGIAAFASLPLLSAAPAFAESVDTEKLMEKGALEDIAVGSEDAPVTIVEYFSMTCGHCANFHATTFKHLEENYIAKDKVRFVLREFPLDPLAAAGAMLARRAPGGKAEEVIDLLLSTQRTWAYAENPVDALQTLAKQAGFTQASFKEALTDQKLLDDITAVRERGSNEFGINSTPSFFVNGEKHVGALSSEEFDKILEPLLK
ncbi:DsbA family protein [Cohaesibacter celericrescens]|uniref:Disulfide bond formation protein DsbA n=1 Tax=Cohaesibacter celericrescens TaxID=2067669 RepID=A0A2N5XKM0_9HYPH|nr:DsbA family protein [Cohaesibacter celericrescens]PLW75063.1 disulfide bond formation protein DsbA [Cohaesibacter celericrescens]